MLKLLDLFLTILHLIILGSLFAWIPVRTREIHLWLVGITLFCWIGLGIKYGMGYCPITDWQWDVKTRLGVQDLPAPFIKYFVDVTFNVNVDPTVVDIATIVCFAISILASLYVNFRK